VAAWRRWADVMAERPWPLMSGESAGYTAGPCGVLAPASLDVQGAACVVWLVCLLRLLEGQEDQGLRVLSEIKASQIHIFGR